MRIAHWRRASAADQTPKAGHPTYRELETEEITKVSGGVSVGESVPHAPSLPCVPRAPSLLLAVAKTPRPPVSATLIGILI
jgi:hypothetical protein